MKGESGNEGATAPGFAMAFQPIVDLVSGEVYAHEALVRSQGAVPGGAAAVLSRIEARDRHAFDLACRVAAMTAAAKLGLPGFLAINILPHAARVPTAGLGRTLEAARANNLLPHRIILEISEEASTGDVAHLRAVCGEYRDHGLLIALDDFGAGQAALTLLAELQPDILKLDINLTRGVHGDRARHAIVRSVVAMCEELRITVIAEGIEQRDDVRALLDLQVRLYQGYLFARPEVGVLPAVDTDVVDGLSVTQQLRRPAFAG